MEGRHIVLARKGGCHERLSNDFIYLCSQKNNQDEVCIAEKTSVARDIAPNSGQISKGRLHGRQCYQVTWTFGHLCELKEPHDYPAELEVLDLGGPAYGARALGIKLIPDQGIERLLISLPGCTARPTIINCGDAGQEGALIQRWVMQLAKVKCPVKRL
jgi:DNA topoisomerase-3